METVRGPGRGVSRVGATITHQSACLCGTGCKIRLGALCRNRWRARRHENLWRISASAEARKEIWFYSRRCRCGRLYRSASHLLAMAIPTLVATPWPSGPVVVSTPDVQRYSGWPGHLLSSWRNFLRSSTETASSPNVSYLRLTALTPAKCSRAYNNVEAWPAERINRSRLGQMGSLGSNRK